MRILQKVQLKTRITQEVQLIRIAQKVQCINRIAQKVQ